MEKCAGLIYGPEWHHLDHLAVICQIMGIPLIVTEEEMAQKARKYYPELDLIHSDYLTILDFLVSHFDIIIYSMNRDLFNEIFFFAQKFRQKRVHTIWCPHGNSDKGENIPFMEALHKEEVALLYGPKMIDFLKRKGVFDQLKAYVQTGNYRYQFYLEHKNFYDHLVEREVLRRLPSAEKTLLYAPTWRDYENSSSFFDATQTLIEKLPDNWNLIIKLHPNLLVQDQHLVQEIIDNYQDRERVLFLTDFPPIYPLLNAIDIYIGDTSSIGYDFLTFDRPLFFLNQNNRELFLFRCGVTLTPSEYPNIYDKINFEMRDFSPIRREVYEYTFGKPKELKILKNDILGSYRVFPEDELNFF